MKSSQEWWESVKADEAALLRWLRKQFHGERTAAWRLRAFLAKYIEDKNSAAQVIVEVIINQEESHADWIGGLLRARGIVPEVIQGKHERYWDETLDGIESFATGCAVASHAERMRLDRIRAIAADENAPADIRGVFKRILPQEVFHERAFRKLAGEEAMRATAAAHERGAAALGLTV